jgi:hypothetical protein
MKVKILIKFYNILNKFYERFECWLADYMSAQSHEVLNEALDNMRHGFVRFTIHDKLSLEDSNDTAN